MFSNPAISSLEQALDGSALKQRTIADNIANVDTPNYKAKEVVFQNELNQHLEAYRTDSRHINFSTGTGTSYSVRSQTGTEMNQNGNNVDIDQEMAEMGKNQIYYQTLIQQINGQFNAIQMVIKGGS